MTTKQTKAVGDTACEEQADFQLPEWLNSALFEKLLQNNVENYKKITNFKAYKALKPGENYLTIMLRIEIELELRDGDSRSVSFMMKIPQQLEMFEMMSKEYNIFDVEAGMYLDIVPGFEQMYRDRGVEVKFGPQCFELPVAESQDYLLLEDLRPYGFMNINRLEGMDVEHTECVLKKLAQWHAASAVRVETKGPYADQYTWGFFYDGNLPAMRQLNEIFYKSLKQHIRSYAGHEDYLDSVLKLLPKIVDELYSTAKDNRHEFNVLNHGDCWCNNIMFQYDAAGKIKETYFLDYQLPKYGTPAQDLFFFLLSSTKFEIKLKEFEYFIKFYHKNLVENLKLLKYSEKLPTLKEIHMALYKYGVWGFSAATGVMTAVLADPNETATYDNFITDSTSGDDFKSLLFSNPRYRKHIEAILPWLNNRGAMES